MYSTSNAVQKFEIVKAPNKIFAISLWERPLMNCAVLWTCIEEVVRNFCDFYSACLFSPYYYIVYCIAFSTDRRRLCAGECRWPDHTVRGTNRNLYFDDMPFVIMLLGTPVRTNQQGLHRAMKFKKAAIQKVQQIFQQLSGLSTNWNCIQNILCTFTVESFIISLLRLECRLRYITLESNDLT